MVNLSLPELLQQEIHPDPVDLCLLRFWLRCLFSHCPQKSQHLIHDRQDLFTEVLFSQRDQDGALNMLMDGGRSIPLLKRLSCGESGFVALFQRDQLQISKELSESAI